MNQNFVRQYPENTPDTALTASIYRPQTICKQIQLAEDVGGESEQAKLLYQDIF